MEVVLLSAMLSCADGAWILGGLEGVGVSAVTKSEIRTEILAVMPDDCLPEQYNPPGRK
tara:strand:- start:1764 stop:1940 length:177 start_codon:yes stop_codon:yes gene_type:complete